MHPDPSDGLRGDRLLSEALAPHTDDDHDATDAGIYVLRCCTVDGGLDAHVAQWREHVDTLPASVDFLAEATHLFYVGSARNVRSRIEDHVAGEKRQATFLEVYPPFAIVQVHWCHADRRQILERQVADEWGRDRPGWQVWCDGALR